MIPFNGALSMSMVRTETSQSDMVNYSLHDSIMGGHSWDDPTYDGQIYSPINVINDIEFGSWGVSKRIGENNFSMSLWRGYDHTLSFDINYTASLYMHGQMNPLQCEIAKSMVILNAGYEDSQLVINISGSPLTAGGSNIEVYYGKPWKKDGSRYTSSISTFITASQVNLGINETFTYDYVYNSSVGPYIYFILLEQQCY